MYFEKIYNKGQALLFRNQYLTKTHPFVIWSLYLPIIILLSYYTVRVEGFDATRTVILFMSGILFWSFTEYILHRFPFHYESSAD